MHIVAAYFCNGSIKLKKGKWSINSEKEKECSEWHLKEFNKLNSSIKKLFDAKFFISMKNIIFEIIEETIGFEDKILGAIKQQKKMEKKKKGKAKIDEIEVIKIEDNFMLDLF